MFDKPRSSRSNENTADFSTSSPDLSSGITSPSRSVATLGESIIIKGDVTGNENLLVEGSIEGKVDLGNHELTIGQAGKVSADVKAKVVNIAGEVKGDIVGLEKVVISRAGNVQGNITAPRVTLEDGAKFKGSIDMDPGSQTGKNKVADIKGSDKNSESAVPA